MSSKTPVVIVSGNFTSGEGKFGNFTARTVDGDTLFIHKKLMEAAGWTAENAPKDADFPFYALAGKKEINTRDEDGNLTDIKAMRLQALSVYKDELDLANAVNAGFRLQLAVQKNREEIVSASGLTQQSVNRLLELA